MAVSLLFSIRVFLGTTLLMSAALKLVGTHLAWNRIVLLSLLETTLGASLLLGLLLSVTAPTSVALFGAFAAWQLSHTGKQGCNCLGPVSARDPWWYSAGRSMLLLGAGMCLAVQPSVSGTQSLGSILRHSAARSPGLSVGELALLTTAGVSAALLCAIAGNAFGWMSVVRVANDSARGTR